MWGRSTTNKQADSRTIYCDKCYEGIKYGAMIKNNQGRKVALEKVRDEMEENHFWQSKQQVQMP